MAWMHTTGAASAAPTFDARAWLDAFTEIGGAYILMPDGRPYLEVIRCDVEPLQRLMAQLVGHRDRVDAMIAVMEKKQLPEDVEAFA